MGVSFLLMCNAMSKPKLATKAIISIQGLLCTNSLMTGVKRQMPAIRVVRASCMPSRVYTLRRKPEVPKEMS